MPFAQPPGLCSHSWCTQSSVFGAHVKEEQRHIVWGQEGLQQSLHTFWDLRPSKQQTSWNNKSDKKVGVSTPCRRES